LKQFLKRRLTYSDILLILVNLVPVFGVWFNEWSPTEAFLVYCLESVVVGLYNVLAMLIVTQFKKKDIWQNGGAEFMVSGYGFIAFFIVHYGFFVFLQMGIFLTVAKINGSPGVFELLFHIKKYLPVNVQWLLLLFIIGNGLAMVKGFIISGDYKTTSLGVLMFSPYARVFIQQFCVILGSLFLSFGWGKVFIIIFVVIKIFFEMLFDYERIIRESVAQKKNV